MNHFPAGFYNGFANGHGYGSHIIRQPIVERTTPRCDEFGAHLMCRDIETFNSIDHLTSTEAPFTTTIEPLSSGSCKVETIADFQDLDFISFFTYEHFNSYAVRMTRVASTHVKI